MSGPRRLVLPLVLALALIGAVGWGVMHRLRLPAITHADIDAALAASWSTAAPDWKARLKQDETQRDCTEARNAPDAGMSEAIKVRERKRIVYPPDGVLLGDWKRGEALAQSGYGGRFTDTNPAQANGGNCYACHQLAAAEISYGTLGPSLTGYGRARGASAEARRAVYDKIYDAQAVLACSSMPRFGASGFLTVEQIRDLVAYVMSPDSPVNSPAKP